MRPSIAVPFLAAIVAFVAPALAVTIAWSPVGNSGNAADPLTGLGSVPYSYSIGTYDVTVSQYVEFLNSNDPNGANQLGLYNSFMSMGYNGISEITYNSAANSGSKYSVMPGNGNHPVIYETYYDALRFANWMNNGQVSGSTETGSYTLLGGTPTPSDANSILRSATATVVIPTENEWYKAAFYNPAASSYYQYPTSSNTAPRASGPTATPNSANYYGGPGVPTDVGAYSGTTSPYGAYDLGGNVFQWNEALFTNINGSFRGVLGGEFSGALALLLSSNPYDGLDPSYEASGGGVGFRLAMLPEPSSLTLAALGLAGLAAWGLRRRRSA